jgi:hypothetical protein
MGDDVIEQGQDSNKGSETPEETPSKELGSAGTLAVHIKRKASKVPLVSFEVRRSERLKKQNLGFKGKACKERKYLCCDIETPTISSKTIRNLGRDFCKMPARLVPDEALKKKGKDKDAAPSKSSKELKAKTSKNVNNAGNPSKMSRKE